MTPLQSLKLLPVAVQLHKFFERSDLRGPNGWFGVPGGPGIVNAMFQTYCSEEMYSNDYDRQKNPANVGIILPCFLPSPKCDSISNRIVRVCVCVRMFLV